MKKLLPNYIHLVSYEHKHYLFDCIYDKVEDTINLYISKPEQLYVDMLWCIGLPVAVNGETIESTLEIAESVIIDDCEIYIDRYKELIED